jgi:tRNA A37 methylthiotransferase MiaB
VRRNRHVEILPLSTGCLGACTYCKTKHARGALGSYSLEALVARFRVAVADLAVREVWLSSEDTGAYGRDIGTGALCAVLCACVRMQSGRLWNVATLSKPKLLRQCMQSGPILTLAHTGQYTNILKTWQVVRVLR